MSISVVPLGGAKEIGGSSYLFEFDGELVLVDCGLRPGVSRDDPDYLTKVVPNLDLIKKTPVCVVTTHGHLDHAGASPTFSRMFPGVPNYMSEETRAFSSLQWNDTLKIDRDRPHLRVFSEGDVTACQKAVRPLPIGGCIDLGHGISVEAIRAGHILGAISPKFKFKGKTIFVSGDFSCQDQTVISGANFDGIKVDFVLSEATYLARSRQSFGIEKGRFIADVLSVLRRGGKVLIPAFSIGRSQEVYQILRESGLFEQFDIWIDGGATYTSKVSLRYLPDKIDPDIEKHFVSKEDRGAHRHNICHDDKPCVVIVPSGMLEGGYAISYTRAWIGGNKNALMFTGYLDPNTLGYRVCYSRDGDEFDFPIIKRSRDGEITKIIPVARVRHCLIPDPYQFSAHAAHEDLLATWRGLNPKKLVLVHGSPENINWAVQNPNEILPGAEVIGPQNGERIILEP
ncbi:MAG: RNA-metabolising metallo-beta-lactamase [Parcubacteria group bacterium GW2011_GWA2_39_18]|nr:MAG: RNA-metabolising metallo-beta-lactamase [Parcubacteria group bacterium GW2011_GWA2_39_18]